MCEPFSLPVYVKFVFDSQSDVTLHSVSIPIWMRMCNMHICTAAA